MRDRLRRWWLSHGLSVRVSAAICARCDGIGIDPILSSVVCASCNGTGTHGGDRWVRVRLTPETIVRIALGEFRIFPR
jgi:hypothetical protein